MFRISLTENFKLNTAYCEADLLSRSITTQEKRNHWPYNRDKVRKNIEGTHAHLSSRIIKNTSTIKEIYLHNLLKKPKNKRGVPSLARGDWPRWACTDWQPASAAGQSDRERAYFVLQEDGQGSRRSHPSPIPERNFPYSQAPSSIQLAKSSGRESMSNTTVEKIASLGSETQSLDNWGSEKARKEWIVSN